MRARSSKAGISTTIFAVGLVIVLIVAGVGGYLAGAAGTKTITSTVAGGGSTMTSTVTTTATATATATTTVTTSTSSAPISSPQMVAQANQEGQVQILDCLNVPTTDAVVSAFNQMYPNIKVTYTRESATGIFDAIQTELQAGNPSYDLVLNCELGVMQILEQMGAFQNYTSSQAQYYPTQYGSVAGVPVYGSDVVGILYNNQSMTAADAPTSLMGLLNSSYAGKFSMPDPALHSGTTEWLYSLQQFFPNQSAWESWIQGLHSLNPILEKSFEPTTQAIISGQAEIGITLVKHIVAHAPAPLSYVNTGNFLSGPDAMALGVNPPDPAAARVFIDFVLSQYGAQVLTSAGGQQDFYPGVFPPIPGANTWNITFYQSLNATELQTWGQTFHQGITTGK